MIDETLASDDARRTAGRGDVKSEIGGDVDAEIAARAASPRTDDSPRIEAVASALRSKAVDEVVSNEREVRVARGVARLSQVVDFLFCGVYAVLALRFGLALLAARSGAGFAQVVTAISDPLYEPFRAIIAGVDLGTGHHVVLPIVVAIIAYLLAHLGVHQLLRVIAERRAAI